MMQHRDTLMTVQFSQRINEPTLMTFGRQSRVRVHAPAHRMLVCLDLLLKVAIVKDCVSIYALPLSTGIRVPFMSDSKR